MTLSGARRFASSGQRSRETALASSAPMPPSVTIGAPDSSRSRNLLIALKCMEGPGASRERRAGPPPAALSVLGSVRSGPRRIGATQRMQAQYRKLPWVHLSLVLG